MLKLGAEQWSAIAAVFSAATAGIALWITIGDESTPYKQALYEERWHSYEEYARASTEFDVALADASAAITRKVDTPEGLNKMTELDLLRASESAAPVLRAKRRYEEELAGILGPWPTNVVHTVMAADAAGDRTMECHILLGVHGQDMMGRPDWWNFVRNQAKTHCSGLHSDVAVDQFDAASKRALAAMRDAIRNGEGLIPGEKAPN